MNKFPRTTVGGLSVSRMIIGTNWMLGWSHTTAAKDDYITENVRDRKKIADILEVFFNVGVDTIIGNVDNAPLVDSIKDAEDRTGVKGIIISTPGFPVTPRSLSEVFQNSEVEAILDRQVKAGASICMPHQAVTDSLLDGCTREIRQMDALCRMIRERKMISGLSTHAPEAITYADETGLDVETYISIYNAMGFLMHVEVDWIASVIWKALKPVLTIKPLAAGQLRPFQGLNFVWNTLREQDMVAVGTMSPKEAAECVEMSLSILERRQASVKLQETRSKASIKKKA